jgi:hypothetical protein
VHAVTVQAIADHTEGSAMNHAFVNTRTARVCHASLLALMLAAGSAWASKAAPISEDEAQYQKERAVCTSGQSNQPRAACLDEAQSARAARRAGTLDSENARTLAANAMRRCKAQPKGDDRAACESKVRGEGQVSGTPAEGGVLKTMTTIQPPEPMPEKAAAPAAAASR